MEDQQTLMSDDLPDLTTVMNRIMQRRDARRAELAKHALPDRKRVLQEREAALWTELAELRRRCGDLRGEIYGTWEEMDRTLSDLGEPVLTPPTVESHECASPELLDLLDAFLDSIDPDDLAFGQVETLAWDREFLPFARGIYEGNTGEARQSLSALGKMVREARATLEASPRANEC